MRPINAWLEEDKNKNNIFFITESALWRNAGTSAYQLETTEK